VFPPDQYAGRPASQPRVTQGVALSYGPVATSSPFHTTLWPPPQPTLARPPRGTAAVLVFICRRRVIRPARVILYLF